MDQVHELMKVLVDEHAAAQMLSIPVGTLRNMRSRGDGPKIVKFGRSVRYHIKELEKFIDKHTRNPNE
jgi:predicted DNA-binding transcriptional regulator AlpA